MNRRLMPVAVIVSALVTAASLAADVKTREKTGTKLEGPLGVAAGLFGGGAKEITSTVVVRGNRKLTMNDLTGRIIDLAEEKVYDLDIKKKEYKVSTFAEIKAKILKDQEEARKRMPATADRPQQGTSEAQYEYDVAKKETGEHRVIAGHDAKEIITTVVAHLKGKTVEESGGYILTTDQWTSPRIAALEEISQFDLRYSKAIYGEAMLFDPQQMAQMSAMFSAFGTMAARSATETGRLGTPVLTTTVFETVKSNDEMKSSGQQGQGDQEKKPSGLGGLFGKMGGKSAPEQKTKIMTMQREMISIDAAALDADVAIPVGFKEKR
jgi:hypothetical protein